MKYIISLLLGLFFATIVYAADSSRFDWTLGSADVVVDTTTTCNNQATIRYAWSLGQPHPVHDATATCNSAITPANTPASSNPIWYYTDFSLDYRPTNKG